MGYVMLVLGLVIDWVGMWMGHVLHWVQLHRRDPFKMVSGQGQRLVFVRIWRKLGGLQEFS